MADGGGAERVGGSIDKDAVGAMLNIGDVGFHHLTADSRRTACEYVGLGEERNFLTDVSMSSLQHRTDVAEMIDHQTRAENCAFDGEGDTFERVLDHIRVRCRVGRNRKAKTAMREAI